MITGDYRRFESAYHLVIASRHTNDLREALRAVELAFDELLTILHRVEWDGQIRLFRIEDYRLLLTSDGVDRVKLWSEAIHLLGIKI
jgi:hypothetical protein